MSNGSDVATQNHNAVGPFDQTEITQYEIRAQMRNGKTVNAYNDQHFNYHIPKGPAGKDLSSVPGML